MTAKYNKYGPQGLRGLIPVRELVVILDLCLILGRSGLGSTPLPFTPLSFLLHIPIVGLGFLYWLLQRMIAGGVKPRGLGHWYQQYTSLVIKHLPEIPEQRDGRITERS